METEKQRLLQSFMRYAQTQQEVDDDLKSHPHLRNIFFICFKDSSSKMKKNAFNFTLMEI